MARGGNYDAFESLNPPGPPDPLPAQPDGAELAAGKQGKLEVRARDRYARIEVFDLDGKRIAAAWQGLTTTLPVGSYRVEVALPTERPVVQSVLVTADEPKADRRPARSAAHAAATGHHGHQAA